jgi:hypothetical protein
MKKVITGLSVLGITLSMGCASITNDAYVPLSLSFSDGSSGTCQLTNKRMSIQAEIPSAPMIRRSDDNLNATCTTDDGRKAFASIPSTMGAKIIASAVFLDFGIVDSITDKHREYPANFVIPVKKNK